VKKIAVALVCCLVGQIILAPQQPLAASSSELALQTAPVTLAPSGSPAEFVPGEVLVKFKSQVAMVGKPGMLPSTSIGPLDALMQSQGVQTAEPVFKDAKKPDVGARVTISGKQQAAPDLTTIYKLRLPANGDVLATVKAFQADPNVEYAEPNYVARMTDTPNDPGYSQQWGLPAVHAEEAWAISKGGPTVTIAILDTGVDLNHPDLVGKFWTNPGEIPGNGIDDDGNGYIDDANGWDFVNGDNTPQDDNGHGTHVAGIAAAETNNGVGMAGLCWNCRIMPVKVMQSSGRGSYSDIAAGVNYARLKGARVINMSLGGYGDSAVLRDALMAAYSNSVLVAAAGNDGVCVGPGRCPDGKNGMPFFPAAYSFVIGVEATDSVGGYASFSNNDQDGPTYSGYNEGYNYAIRAPGVSIYSTMFDDTYASLSGTSMAAPMVAGAAGLLVSRNPTWSKERIRAQLVQSATGVSDNGTGLLNIYSALTSTPSPVIKLVTGSIIVGDGTGDKDGRVDAGETITLTMTLRNYGAGEATGTVATLTTIDEHTTVNTGSSSFGDISAYAANTDLANPFVFSVSSTAPNNHDITFRLNLTANGGSYTRDLGTFYLTVQRGQEIGGVISSDTILTADRFYIVTSSLLVPSGVTLTVQPGTTLCFERDKYLQVEGTLVARGMPTNPILFTASQSQAKGFWGDTHQVSNNGIRFMDTSTDALFDTGGDYLSGSILQHTIVEYGTGVSVSSSAPFIDDNVIRHNGGNAGAAINVSGSSMTQPVISHNLVLGNDLGINIGYGQVRNNILTDNSAGVSIAGGVFEKNVVTRNAGWPGNSAFGLGCDAFVLSVGNSIYANIATYDMRAPGCFLNATIDATNNWWGTTDSTTVAQRIYDVNDDFNLGRINYVPFLNAPDPTSPPILHTAAVSPGGIVGTGSMSITLVFSRPMSTSVQPVATFGVTTPYSQHSLSGSWTNSTTWVGTFRINVSTGDGINSLRVTEAIDSEGTEIPTDERFQFTIQTAGSSSLSLSASPGYGRVTLNWSVSPLTNTIGYNIYRGITNTAPYTGTVVNNTLVTGISYTDTSAANGTKYFYKYAIVDTDLREVAFSNEVNATPNDYTAPTTPLVTDDGTCTISTTTLRARWSASDPDSGIAEYQYGIGEGPGGVDVINWTSVGTSTGVTRTGLSLTNGYSYYFTVKARNGVGAWGNAGNSDGITVDNACVPAPGAPILLSPSSGTITTTQAVTLAWQAGAGSAPAGYNVQVDGNVITTTNTTSATVLSKGVHTWTVRAYNATGYSDWVAPDWTVEIPYSVYLPLVLRNP
jgi:subtilisin family serine protease/fibronectin type 3 domain-containing protein